MKIRLAVINEVPVVQALYRRAVLANSSDREQLASDLFSDEDPVAQIECEQMFVAEEDASIVGYASVMERSDGQAEIDALFVEPSRWRQGIGRQLVGRCLEYARVHGVSELHVVGNPNAKSFYASCGFKLYGRCKTVFGTGLLLMKSVD